MTIPREIREISSDVYWVGVRDWERKFFGVVESHGWAGGAVRELANLVEGTSGELLDPIEIKGSPEEEDLERVVELGEEIVEKIIN